MTTGPNRTPCDTRGGGPAGENQSTFGGHHQEEGGMGEVGGKVSAGGGDL